tara:strand:+ start:899 stop:1171 length:273 start_codon:yes stop_codon:yes gene_type:complete
LIINRKAKKNILLISDIVFQTVQAGQLRKINEKSYDNANSVHPNDKTLYIGMILTKAKYDLLNDISSNFKFKNRREFIIPGIVAAERNME